MLGWIFVLVAGLLYLVGATFFVRRGSPESRQRLLGAVGAFSAAAIVLVSIGALLSPSSTARIVGLSLSIGLGVAYLYAALIPQSRLFRAIDYVSFGPSSIKRPVAGIVGVGFMALGIFLSLR